MAEKIIIIHFHNGTGGGVLSVIRNLLTYKQHDEIENHVIYTINRDQIPHFTSPGLPGSVSEQVFNYSPQWNFYYTCRQLAELLPDENAIILAHDWLELGMVSNLGLQNPVVHILHGNYTYYFELAVKHEKNIDAFVCIAAAVYEKLLELLPHRTGDIYYKRFPVHKVIARERENRIPKLVFIGRCEQQKGYYILPQIEADLLSANYGVEWHIIGQGSLEKEKQHVWPSESNVFFYGELTNEEVLSLIPSFDFTVLPSLAEGMPVTVVEAMKAGVIPIVNDLPGGLQEIVINGETGYRIGNNNPADYARQIIYLGSDKELKKKIEMKAKQLAEEWFDPCVNTTEIETVFFKAAGSTGKPKMKKKIYGSRLDQPWLPNNFVTAIRRFTFNK